MPDPLILAIRERVPEPPLPPLTEREIAEGEARLGFALPPLLRELYQCVGNGRFGPGCGLLSLDDLGDHEFSAVGLYLEFHRPDPEDTLWNWPDRLLPFCHWGCTMFSCIDCGTPPNPVVSLERTVGRSVEESSVLTRESFEEWLRDWLAGKSVFESVHEHDPGKDRTFTNPFTGQPMVLKGKKPRRR